jgi:electron transfer flavoprotein beta subunit
VVAGAVTRICGRPGGGPTIDAMHVVVCVKQIPDPAEPGQLDPSTKTLKRAGKLILDESDSYGVEMALQLADALAMGAADAILVSDEALQGTSALGTAKVLAAAIGRRSPDLILTATESSDGYTGTVPTQVAELLGLPAVTFAKSVTVSDATLHVNRQTESGFDEVTCPLPAVVSVTAGVVEPRYPSFKGIMAAKAKPVEELSVTDLGLSADDVGWAGGGEEIVEVAQAEARQAGEIIEDEGEGFAKVVAFLENLKVI